jgi:hypothetical protein
LLPITPNSSYRNDGSALGELTSVLGRRPAVTIPARGQTLALVVMRVLPVGITVNQILRDGLHGTVSVEQLLVLVKERPMLPMLA